MRTVVVRLQDEAFEAVTVDVRRKTVVRCTDGPAAFTGLSGKRTVVLWEPSGTHFLREQVYRGPGDVVALQIQEKVERTGFFRTAPSVFYQVEREEGQVAHVFIAAMDLSGLDDRLETLWRHGARIQGVFHPAVAVAFLAARSFTEKTLTVWIQEHGFYLAVTENGRILSLRFVGFDAFTGPSESLVREESSFTLQQHESAGGQGITRIQACGPLHHLLDASQGLWEGLGIAEPLKKAALKHPEWFGAFFVPAPFNMLPQKVQVWNRHMPWAMRAAAALLAVSLCQAGLWMYWKSRAQGLEKQTREAAAAVAGRAEAVQKAIPWDRMAVVEEYRRAVQAFEKEPRMDAWMVWLAETVPKNFRVVRCAVSKQGESARGRTPGPTHPSRRRESPAQVAQGPVLSLELRGTVAFQEAHRAFGVFLAALKERKNEVSGIFDYDEKTGQAAFSFEVPL